jgi:hypothetical protein
MTQPSVSFIIKLWYICKEKVEDYTEEYKLFEVIPYIKSLQTSNNMDMFSFVINMKYNKHVTE